LAFDKKLIAVISTRKLNSFFIIFDDYFFTCIRAPAANAPQSQNQQLAIKPPLSLYTLHLMPSSLTEVSKVGVLDALPATENRTIKQDPK
jgi:hypothetical protein